MPLLIPSMLLWPRIALYLTLLLPIERSEALLVPSKPNSGRLRCSSILGHFCHNSNVSIRILYPAVAFSSFLASPSFSRFLLGGCAHRYSRCIRPIRLPPSSANSSSNPPNRWRSSSSFSYLSSWLPHSPSACSKIDFERRFRYFLTCAIHSWWDKPNSAVATE